MHPRTATSAKMLRAKALSTHLSGHRKTLHNNALTLSMPEVCTLVSKTSFYNCAETKLASSCLVRERKGEGWPPGAQAIKAAYVLSYLGDEREEVAK